MPRDYETERVADRVFVQRKALPRVRQERAHCILDASGFDENRLKKKVVD